MGYFPLCIDLRNADIILVGEGDIAREKLNILLPFGANIRLFSSRLWEDRPCVRLVQTPLEERDLDPRPAFVVVADVSEREKKRISTLCRQKQIPVNVVDEPALCSFYFPSLITRGPLTVAVSTGGKSPGAAVWLRRNLEEHIPERTEEILEWAHTLRQTLKAEVPEIHRKAVLRKAIASAFEKGCPLGEEEISLILHDYI